MANTVGRVIIPGNPKDRLDLAQKVFDKHMADGAASELNNMASPYNWGTAGGAIKPSQVLHKKAEDLKGEMEKTYRERDTEMAAIDKHLTATAKYLKGKYSDMPKKLSEWGFSIDDTPKKPKKKP
jgi:hypothetical protein